MLKTWLYSFIGIFVSVLFVYLAIRQIDPSEIARTLARVQPMLLASGTLVFLSGYLIRALRWQRILRSQKKLSVRQTIVPVFVGYMANNLLPARAGELYRAHFLGRRSQISRSGAAASIVVERTFDGMMLVFLIIVASVLFPDEGVLSATVLFTGLAFLVLATGILLYMLLVDKTHQILGWGIGLLPARFGAPIGIRLKFFLHGMRGISSLGGAIEVGAYTVVIWIIEISAYTLTVLAFDVALPLAGYVLVYTLAALSTALPTGPAYIGPYQYAFVLALGVFAVSRETALAVSVGAQVALLGSVTIIGLLLLWGEKLRSRRLQNSKSEQENIVV